jgi:cytoskeletal protein CcmA (bactofilin family)
MKISGSGRLSGGKIDDELVTSGSARIDGDFECNGFRSSGSFRGTGNLIVHGDFRSSGSFRIHGSLKGDGNGKTSGSASVEGKISIDGFFTSSGSLRVGDKIEALEGIRTSGSATIQDGLFSQQTIDIEGSITVHGKITGRDVFIGSRRTKKFTKQPFKVYDNIFGINKVDITGTFVEGDVKGRNLRIGPGSEISGTVYYVDNIEIAKKATLAKEPVQITADELHNNH